ncbi:Uncharacterised protein [Vibrio cholerae]|nr:Uncharacterised protein [Vibrio cholerae]CSD48327.1 Uncharacterised protein [Vibrio cholerae]
MQAITILIVILTVLVQIRGNLFATVEDFNRLNFRITGELFSDELTR